MPKKKKSKKKSKSDRILARLTGKRKGPKRSGQFKKMSARREAIQRLKSRKPKIRS